MKNRKTYLVLIIITLTVVGILLFLNSAGEQEKMQVKSFYQDAKQIKLIKNTSDNSFVLSNFPAVERAYEIDGKLSAYIVSSVGYNGPIELLVAMDSEKNKLKGIKVLNNSETVEYAENIESNWFLDRFKNIGLDKYFNLVVLDKKNPEDIVQVTGATVSSQAVVNGINSAIGAYQYLNNKVEMAKVSDVVSQEMWQKDDSSFSINWEDGSVRINSDELKKYEQVEVDAVLINTTGTKTDLHVKGPTLSEVLHKEGIELSDYQGIGITGRDGYYTMVDKEKLDANQVILGWQFDGKEIKEDEKPIRVVISNEMGPYWVKMVSNIDLYKEVSPKQINKVYMFDALTRDIEPYYYEYYGSKDKSIEVGKILSKFDLVDLKGFFTMTSEDGLTKNETISIVRQRYFIKVEGENSPMNIAPNFKLGMNVKNMSHFSTTKDAVIFPDEMKKVVRTKNINGLDGMLLEDVLLTAGMRWEDNSKFKAVNTDGTTLELSLSELLECYINNNNNQVILFDGNEELLKDLLRIECIETKTT
jgi:Na+-translocating ferredoxin:NAD+ oxidoreductase RnfG subunit